MSLHLNITRNNHLSTQNHNLPPKPQERFGTESVNDRIHQLAQSRIPTIRSVDDSQNIIPVDITPTLIEFWEGRRREQGQDIAFIQNRSSIDYHQYEWSHEVISVLGAGSTQCETEIISKGSSILSSSHSNISTPTLSENSDLSEDVSVISSEIDDEFDEWGTEDMSNIPSSEIDDEYDVSDEEADELSEHDQVEGESPFNISPSATAKAESSQKAHLEKSEKKADSKHVSLQYDISTLSRKEMKELMNYKEGLVEKKLCDPEKEVEQSFYYKGELIAKDTIYCIKSLPWMLDLFEDRRKRILHSLAEESGEHPLLLMKANLMDSLVWNRQAISNIQEKMAVDASERSEKIDWYDSKYFRNLLNSDPNADYESLIAKYSPGPINFRLQKIGDYSWLRAGVMSVLPRGLLNQRELKNFLDDPKALKAKQKELLKMRKSYQKKGEKRIVQAIDYHLKQIESIPQIKASIEHGRRILRDQMVMLVMSQLMENQSTLSQLDNGDPFTFVHLSLLNEHTKTMDPSGWAHYENNEMLDMFDIFQEFKGKPVFFEAGLTKPHLDFEGNLHLPKIDQDGPDSIILNPIFFNISPQGNNNLVGIQKKLPIQDEINRQGYKELQKDFNVRALKHPEMRQEKYQSFIEQKDLKRAMKKINKGSSNYGVAVYLVTGLLENKIVVSFGCLSAKDRTGFKAEFIGRLYVKRKVRNEKRPSFVKQKMYNYKINQGALSSSSNAARVIGQNTGADCVKSTAPLISGPVPINPFLRAGYYVKQAFINEPAK